MRSTSMVRRRPLRRIRGALPVVVGLVVLAADPAPAGMAYVANHGVDGPDCGSKEAPCRSIYWGLRARPHGGGTILVGPGRYGDLNRNGILGEPGEEPSSKVTIEPPNLDKIDIRSVYGAGVTIIDGVSFEFRTHGSIGRRGGGFTFIDGGASIRQPAAFAGNRTVRGGVGVSAAGNGGGRVTGNIFYNGGGAGLVSPILFNGEASDNFAFLGAGMHFHAVKAKGNVVMRNDGDGVVTESSQTRGTFSIGNAGAGFVYTPSGVANARLSSSAALDNAGPGIRVSSAGPRTFVERCDVTGNDRNGANCGILNEGTVAGPMPRTFWGLATGPGGDPADDACGPLDVPSFAMRPNVHGTKAGR